MSAAIVDCDLWPQRATGALIAPYMDPAVRAYLRLGEPALPNAPAGFDLPESGIRSAARRAAALADAGDPHVAVRRLLESRGVARAILNPGVAAGLSGLASGRLAARFAAAINDWLAAEWLETDDRYRGSIVVSARDATLAAAEIRRLSGDRRFVQVLLAYPPDVLGAGPLRPIHEAAEEAGLPISLQSGGWLSGINRGIAATGYPSSPLEDEFGSTFAAQPHLVSMIVRGVFDRHPGLRLVLSGFGIAWLPSVLWRLDSEAVAGRLEASVELSRLPSEYVRERVRFTTQPLEIPDRAATLVTLLDSLGGDELLMYASGDPRWRDTAGSESLRSVLPAGWMEPILAGNAIGLYRQ